MAAPVMSRETESWAVEEFLASVPSDPAALVVEGEAGIGKTTVWLAGLERAEELGFRVLSARATSAESVLPYSGLAALLEGLDEAVFADLPPLQRLAIDRVTAAGGRRGWSGHRSTSGGGRLCRRSSSASRSALLYWWRSMICSGLTHLALSSSRPRRAVSPDR